MLYPYASIALARNRLSIPGLRPDHQYTSPNAHVKLRHYTLHEASYGLNSDSMRSHSDSAALRAHAIHQVLHLRHPRAVIRRSRRFFLLLSATGSRAVSRLSDLTRSVRRQRMHVWIASHSPRSRWLSKGPIAPCNYLRLPLLRTKFRTLNPLFCHELEACYEFRGNSR
ncbi:hypothetical protein KC326_g110 [Hortaea werneckii]|nr:hypothetical protein KC326_g110 [Hortaea werneckii]